MDLGVVLQMWMVVWKVNLEVELLFVDGVWV